jgi:beta-lactamase class D
MYSIIPILILLLTIAATAFAEDASIARLFNTKNIQGTIVISSLDGTTTYSHNDTRAAIRMLPASTFKIPNTLIALEEGAINDETQVLKWDGKERNIAAWNRDQTLESAFKSSCVWAYQELARRIGTARYESYLTQIGYGNALPTPILTTFWLEGDLRISALEQIAFLKRLYRRKLPFKPTSYDALKRIMIVEQTPAYTVRAKTGWAGFGKTTAPQIGWYVGYLEAKGNVWLFALNMDISKPADAGLRQKIVMEALKSKGLL